MALEFLHQDFDAMSTISLPMPPSVNALWRNGKGRTFRSRRYVAWLRDAGWELVTQKPKRFPGAVKIDVAVGRPDRRKRDLDNVATKAVLDLLTAHAVLSDGSMVTKITASWDNDVAPGTVRVTIAAMAMA